MDGLYALGIMDLTHSRPSTLGPKPKLLTSKPIKQVHISDKAARQALAATKAEKAFLKDAAGLLGSSFEFLLSFLYWSRNRPKTLNLYRFL